MAARIHVVPLDVPRISEFMLYQTHARYYCVGRVEAEPSKYHVLKIERGNTSPPLCTEDQHVYSKQEVDALLVMLSQSNNSWKSLGRMYGIVGFITLTGSPYLLVITGIACVSLVAWHNLYRVTSTSYFPLKLSGDEVYQEAAESHYKQLFFGMDLSTFYFSPSYDLTRTLQMNSLGVEPRKPNGKFWWNQSLAEPSLREMPRWLYYCIHGFAKSFCYTPLFDNVMRVTLISRRSRHYAGTRYLKRGISDDGYCANDVESEQICEIVSHCSEIAPHLSSFVQIRGSIPLFWSQEFSITVPKPDIHVDKFDPFHEAATLHFQDLFRQYGSPVIVLNLVKQKEKKARETILGTSFGEQIEYLNSTLPSHLNVLYTAWDFHAARKDQHEDVISAMIGIARSSVLKTGWFHTGSRNDVLHEGQVNTVHEDDVMNDYKGLNHSHVHGRIQEGILRSNCIDSLDRTNATQFCIGVAALGNQLYAMGVTGSPVLEFASGIVAELLHLYEQMGDMIALQYAGSQLAHRMNTYKNASSWSAASKDLMTSIKRFYTSTFTDVEKQMSINLFLGKYKPFEHEGGFQLWDLPTDTYLHNPPRKHRCGHAPLSTKQWWREPLDEWYHQNSVPVLLPATPAPPVPRKPLLDEPIEYSAKTSRRFKAFYMPHRISFFDEMLAQLYFTWMRPSAAVAAVAIKRPEKSDSGVSEYANYMNGFSSWVKNLASDRGASRPVVRPKKTTVADNTEPRVDEEQIKRQKARALYGAYIKYPAEGIWENNFANRQIMAKVSSSKMVDNRALYESLLEMREARDEVSFTRKIYSQIVKESKAPDIPQPLGDFHASFLSVTAAERLVL